MDRQEFYLEGILVLNCYIGALSRLRYPTEDMARTELVLPEIVLGDEMEYDLGNTTVRIQ